MAVCTYGATLSYPVSTRALAKTPLTLLGFGG